MARDDRGCRDAAINRRSVLAGGVLAGVPGLARAQAPRGAAAIVAEDPGFAAVVDPAAPVATLYASGRWCEGPVWVPRLGALVFSDVRRNRMLRLGPDGPPAIQRDPSANANGNALDAEQRLVTCEHGNRRVVREEPDGRLTVLADRFEGRPLNAPNDVVVARDGAVWFTDPTYGIDNPEEGRPAPSEQRGRFVYRLDPDGGLAVASDSFVQPNGLAFSPDGTILYVSESSGGAGPEAKREIRAFDVIDGRRLARERVFARLASGAPDGLKVDVEGRLYAGTGEGARVWRPDGTPLGRIATPGPCANIAFGGRDGRRLFLCSGPAVLAVDLRARGHVPV